MSWFWRWGAPATAVGGALAAAGLGAIWLSGSDAAGRAGEAGISAAAFAATLLLSWGVIVCRRPGAGRRPPSPSPQASRLTDALLATVVVSAVLVVTGAVLDGPVVPDERKTLLRHVLMPLGKIASTYDDPNNHVLHTLAVGVAHRFGGWSLPVLRLPAFASFCLLLPALWWFAQKEYGPTAATFATVFVGTSPLLVEYATHARGYTLLILMFMAMLLCGRALVRQPDRTALWAAWAVAAALGFYTVPLMAFPALTAAAWMLLARWREGGRAAMRPFAVKTAAWSLAAVAGAALLYAPILASMGVRGVYETIVGHIALGHVLSASPALLWRPFEFWHIWNFKLPVGAQGVLFALVVVGVAVPGRGSRPGAGALLLAAGLATGLLLAAKPFMPRVRMMLWALPLFMTAAGVGAAFVLERAVGWAGTRWPRIAAGAGRSSAVGCAIVLTAGALAHWSAQSSLYKRPPVHPPVQGWRLGALVSSAAPLMASGDHFATFNWWAQTAVIQMREHLRADFNSGFWFPFGQSESRWSVHQVAGAGDESRVSDAGTDPTQGRLFVLYPRDPRDTLRTFAKEFVDVHPPDHQLVAALDGGLVYVLHDWTKHPWRNP